MIQPNAVSSPAYVNGTPDWVKPIIDQASKQYNVPSVLLSALLKQESGFKADAQSKVGAQGIAQFMPATAKGFGIDPLDPSQAIPAAAHYLRNSLDHFGGDVKKALASYNAGTHAVETFNGVPPYPETQRYVKNILSMSGEPHETFNGPQIDIVQDAKKQSQKPAQVTGRREGVPVQAMYKSPPPVQINNWRDALKQFLFPRVPAPEQMTKPQNQYQEGYAAPQSQTTASAPQSSQQSGGIPRWNPGWSNAGQEEQG